MIATIWYIAKPGTQRTYATTVPPSAHWAKSLKSDGYKIFCVEFEMPDNWDGADYSTKAAVK